MPEPQVQLHVNGQIYSGWKDVQFTLALDQAVNPFSLHTAEKWSAARSGPAILPGHACELLAGPARGSSLEPVVKGWVDQVSISSGPSEHSFSISGRDAACDLVDCSAIHSTGQWKKQTLLKIAQDLLAPFGIPVTAQADVGGKFDEFAIDQGETVFDCLKRAAWQRGLLLYSDGAGGVVLARSGGNRLPTALVLGRNVKSSELTSNLAARYSVYQLKAQIPTSDEYSCEGANQVNAEAKDEGVPRYRPLVIVAQEAATKADLEKQAAHERSRRISEALRYECVVPGWFDGTGKLWRPNNLVKVQDSRARLDRELLLVSAAFQLSGNAYETRLSLAPREAYALEPFVPEKKSSTPSVLEGIAS